MNGDQVVALDHATYSPNAFEKPMLRSQNSIHVPGHIILPLPSLVVHPFPRAVHPIDNLEQRSISDVRQTIQSIENPPTEQLRENTIEWQEYREMFNRGRRVSVASIGGDHPKRAVVIAALPILPIQAAVVCLVLNVLVPGSAYAQFIVVALIN
ncbi:hypothetical protein AC249_AIPGENE14548 [Exaiptasia diaphana]|nr:hypothetical protein AC249_AIPGENE14548 [Exaiptasia diaphana]